MKKILATASLVVLVTSSFAQSGTNSPYSQYGLGELSDQTSGFNRGMNGLGLGFREHNQVNYINPASYSALDSLSFIFDMGISGQLTNFKENSRKVNAKNADLEYVQAGFRAARHLGVSFGVLPFTNVGYDYSFSGTVNGDANNTTYTNEYSGSGGLHQVYLGFGWEPFKGFAFGANASYLWGNYTRTVNNVFSGSSSTNLMRIYTADMRSYKFDFGLQYTLPLSKKDRLTLGLTYSPGHDIGGEPRVVVRSYTVTSSSQMSVIGADTLGGASLSHKIPHIFGAGFAFNHQNRWKVGVDYSLQKWSSLEAPIYESHTYTMRSGFYKDRSKLTAGGEFCNNPMGRRFFDRIRYRVGASYATPYYTINGQDGPKEISVSAGFGIPIINSANNRSILNISGQCVNRSADGLIKENTFRINIGLTFNERWFMKWKVD